METIKIETVRNTLTKFGGERSVKFTMSNGDSFEAYDLPFESNGAEACEELLEALEEAGALKIERL